MKMGRGLWIATLPVLFALSGATASLAAEGKEVFLSQKCNMCHPMEAQGIKATMQMPKMEPGDLSKVGAEHDAAWIEKYLTQQAELNSKKHTKKWTGSEEDLKALAEWLGSMK